MAAKYVLMTPARNEAAYIGRTLLSVANQTVQPERWIIVDDRSSDDTGLIVKRFAADHPFVELLEVTGDDARNFGSKAKALKAAYQALAPLDFDYVCNLDADVSFHPEYFESIMGRFEAQPKLGIAGGIQFDRVNDRWELLRQAKNSVAGPFQMFRRACYEEIGGYQNLPYGGVDTTAEFSARKHGWLVESFDDQIVYHHRETGTAIRGFGQAKFRGGQRDFTLGYHPAFFLMRTLNSMKEGAGKGVLGGLATIAGFVTANITRPGPRIPAEVRTYLRKEQTDRIKSTLFRREDPVGRHRSTPTELAPAPYGA